MRKLTNIVLICLCLLALPALCETASKWQVATILAVNSHVGVGETAPDPASYDVTVKVGGTTYVVLYTARSDEPAAKYAAGRQLLVLVENNTITYNDMLGRCFHVPIVSQRPASESK